MMRRTGFTLVEVVVTMALVTGFILVITQTFWGTQRQAVGTEARFTSALLAQMVVERLRSELTLNPALFRQLDPSASGRWSATGRVAELPGTQLSPFFEHLFARSATDLYADGNKKSVAPAMTALASAGGQAKTLAEAYADYQIEATITDDEPPAGAGANAPLLREMVKRVAVTVTHHPRGQAAAPESAFTLHARLLAPIENLSMPALDQLFENFESSRLETAYEEFYEAIADNPYFTPGAIDGPARDLLADCYIVLGAINTEAYMSDGRTVAGNTVLTTSQPTAALTTWVRNIQTGNLYQHSVFKKESAKLHGMRLIGLFDAFKKVSPVLKHLLDKQDEMLPKVDSIRTALETALQTIRDLDTKTLALVLAYRGAKQTLATLETAPPDPALTPEQVAQQKVDAQARVTDLVKQIGANAATFSTLIQKQSSDLSAAMELITVVKFLHDFFSRKNYRELFDRLKDYPGRFTGILDELDRCHRDFLDQAEGPTPYERVVAAQRLVEVTKLRQLDRGGPDPGALAKIDSVAEQYTSTVRPLSNYLKTSEVHDYQLLAGRNARFLSSLSDMKKLAKQYERVVKAYDGGGTIREMLALYDVVQKEISLESEGVMAQLQTQIQTLGASLDLIENATPAALLAAIDAVKAPASPAATP